MSSLYMHSLNKGFSDLNYVQSQIVLFKDQCAIKTLLVHTRIRQLECLCVCVCKCEKRKGMYINIYCIKSYLDNACKTEYYTV